MSIDLFADMKKSLILKATITKINTLKASIQKEPDLRGDITKTDTLQATIKVS